MKQKKICILFAYHHNSNNIASVRYEKLIKYIDPDEVEFIVLSNNNENYKGSFSENIKVVGVAGNLIGQSSTFFNLLMLCYFFSNGATRRCLLSWFGKRIRSSWCVNAINVASNIIDEYEDKACFFTMGSYSPYDAIFGSFLFSDIYKLPLIQDFRDGFVFESLGRKNWILNKIKGRLERIVCRQASCITSVSTALVDDFSTRYLEKPVSVLHNGFDVDDFDFDLENDQFISDLECKIFEDKKITIGHFGRISASDTARLNTFRAFLLTFNEIHNKAPDNYRLMFMGELTDKEQSILKSYNFDYFSIAPQPRNISLYFMARCDFLLLLTGDSKGCATGKVFEYINSGNPIICFSGVNNEATKIISNTKTGFYYLTSEDNVEKFWLDLSGLNVLEPVRSEIDKYDKRNQAVFYKSLVEELFVDK